jgi:hypothetical protein
MEPGNESDRYIFGLVIRGLEKIHPGFSTLAILGILTLVIGFAYGYTGIAVALLVCAAYPIVLLFRSSRREIGGAQPTIWLSHSAAAILGIFTLIIGIAHGDTGIAVALLVCAAYPTVLYFRWLRRELGAAQQTIWLYVWTLVVIQLWLVGVWLVLKILVGDSWYFQANWAQPAPRALALITGGASGFFLVYVLRRCPTFLSQVVVVAAYLVTVPFAALPSFLMLMEYPGDALFLSGFSIVAVPVLMTGTYVGWTLRARLPAPTSKNTAFGGPG